MFILCDTCVLLMLLRIAPDMMTDERYNCVVPPVVREELFKTQKFKDKYPWRTRYRAQVQTLPESLSQTDRYMRTLETVELLVATGRNVRTKRRFGLSRVDKMLAAHVIETTTSYRPAISTGRIFFFRSSTYPMYRLWKLSTIGWRVD